MGLPVPQVFFYEKGRNDFLVIDGQQRLMTVYYFLKKRFPKMEKRAELRRVFDEHGMIPDRILSDDDYFDNFNLRLGARLIERPNRLEDLNYDTLESDDRIALELRTIRCIIVKQHEPKDDSSMYEIFYRLNTGGVNLTPQEIRASIYYSPFYEMLGRLNLDPLWRRLTKIDPDIRMRDLETLLRGFALLASGANYKPPMVRFLNAFSEESKKFPQGRIEYFEQLFDSFMQQCKDLEAKALWGRTGRFSVSMYEAIFAVVCEDAYSHGTLNVKPVDAAKLDKLKSDSSFIKASQSQTTSKENVDLRLQKAREILLS
jgi:hypothetical protein